MLGQVEGTDRFWLYVDRRSALDAASRTIFFTCGLKGTCAYAQHRNSTCEVPAFCAANADTGALQFAQNTSSTARAIGGIRDYWSLDFS